MPGSRRCSTARRESPIRSGASGANGAQRAPIRSPRRPTELAAEPPDLPHWACDADRPRTAPAAPARAVLAGRGRRAPIRRCRPDAAGDAARRGVLIHSLLERLPDVARRCARGAARGMAGAAGGRSCRMPSGRKCWPARWRCWRDPEWAEIFSPAALAEVPLAATVGGQVIAGTADRLLVERRPRARGRFQDRAPPACQRWPRCRRRPCARWRAYAAALAAIYPGTPDRGGVALHPDPAADRDSGRRAGAAQAANWPPRRKAFQLPRVA